MSDFDKEAEREKLREKYGEEQDDREATEQMSELLLKGATMTNAHCNNCGDPIFRYDGQEFCPTCQQPVDRADAEAEDDNENIEVTTPSDDARVQFGGEDQQSADSTVDAPQTEEPSEGATGDKAAVTQNASAPQQSGGQSPSPTDDRSEEPPATPSLDPAGTERRSGDRGSAAPAPERAGQQSDSTPTGHLTNAQTMLAETVEQYAQQARDADSPRQAREYLEAAREAAETLAETGY